MTTTRWLFALQLVAMGAMEMSGPFWPLHLRRLGGLCLCAERGDLCAEFGVFCGKYLADLPGQGARLKFFRQ